MSDFWTIWQMDGNGYWVKAESFSSRRDAERAFEGDYRGRPRQLRDPRDVVRRESGS